MKKKNLLTLGALCLSLGLVVSACGEKGETGQTGPQGEPGPAGKDGKTYVDVLVLVNPSDVGGTVKQSTYFVTEGAHDTITFTFEPSGDNNIVTELIINGKAVEGLDPADLSYTIEDADTYQGSIQVQGVRFTSVDTYGPELLADFVKDLAESDKCLDLTVNGEKVLEKAVVNAYSPAATTTVQNAYNEALADLTEAIEKAKTDHKDDVSAQVKAIVAAEKEAETAVTEAYNQALKDAKVLAEGDLTALDKAVPGTDFTEADRKTILDAGKAAVEAATTLEALGKIVSGSALNTEAQYNTLYGTKKTAFEQINAYLEDPSVSQYVDEFKNETIKASLTEWGVSADQDPTEIAKEYKKQVSAATELEVNDDGEIVLVKTYKEAVDNATKGVKDTLLANIRAAYLQEVTDSTTLADSPNAATTIKGVIEAVCSNYKTDDTDKTISDYVGTTAGGLIYELESHIADAIVTGGYKAFGEERLENAKADAVAAFEAKVAEVKKDAGYVAATGYTTKDNVVTPTTKTYKLGENEVNNPFFTKGGEAENPTWTVVAPTGVDVKGPSVVDSNGTAATTTELKDYSVDNWLTTLKAVDEFTGVEFPVLSVKQWESTHVGDFEKIYDKALELYTSSLKSTATSGLTDGTYISDTDVKEKFDDAVKDKTFAEVLGVAQSTAASSEALTTLDKAVTADVAERNKNDDGYIEYFKNDGSSYKEAFDELVTNIISGTSGEADVTAFVAEENLNKLYEADVTTYLNEAKEVLAQVYQNLIQESTSVVTARNLKKVYDNYLAAAGHKVNKGEDGVLEIDDKDGSEDYTCKTIKNVDKWLGDANTALLTAKA